MQDSTLIRAIAKLAFAGEQAGFTVEDMIYMLNSGMTVATLMQLIESSIMSTTAHVTGCSRWVA